MALQNFWQLVTNFADLWRNNGTFTQKNRTFEKYHLPVKFKFRQLMMNFADFRRNNNASMRVKKKNDKTLVWKYQPLENFMFHNLLQILQIFGE